MQKYLAGFPDGRITVDDQILEGDKVATRWTGRGTQTGEIAGIAPTGKQVTITGLTISRLEGGRVIEDWSTWDTLGMLVQLGAIQHRLGPEVRKQGAGKGRRKAALL